MNLIEIYVSCLTLLLSLIFTVFYIKYEHRLIGYDEQKSKMLMKKHIKYFSLTTLIFIIITILIKL